MLLWIFKSYKVTELFLALMSFNRLKSEYKPTGLKPIVVLLVSDLGSKPCNFIAAL